MRVSTHGEEGGEESFNRSETGLFSWELGDPCLASALKCYFKLDHQELVMVD